VSTLAGVVGMGTAMIATIVVAHAENGAAKWALALWFLTVTIGLIGFGLYHEGMFL
jgi:hypothetical protein